MGLDKKTFVTNFFISYRGNFFVTKPTLSDPPVTVSSSKTRKLPNFREIFAYFDPWGLLGGDYQKIFRAKIL